MKKPFVFRKFSMSAALACLMLLAAPAAWAADEETPTAKPSGPSKLLGAPVNTSIAGGAILPQGTLLTALNWSLRDRYNQIHGSDTRDTATAGSFGEIWLLKVRYGLFDRLEINSVVPYIYNDRYDLKDNRYVYGFGDVSAGFSLALLSERAGDPIWATLSGAILLPTGGWGDDNPPGNGVFGGRAALSLTKFITKNIRADADFVVQGPFSRGSQDVMRGIEMQFTTQLRYMFEALPVDIGFESVLARNLSGTKEFDGRDTVSLHNGSTEWVIGPSINCAIEPLGMWVGAGAFFPVVQSLQSSAKLETVRWEFKIGKVW